MDRVYNFSAGPGMLPLEVLEQAREEMLDYRGSGMSVMEMSHRSPVYEEIIFGAQDTLREIMHIPDDYEVLFLQGGASTQFSMVPMNLLTKSGVCDMVNTGMWSDKAIKEAMRYGKVNVVASSEDRNFSYIPALNPSTFTKDADYFHITTNNTIYGTRYTSLPDTRGVPLVADMSSNILSEEYEIRDFALVYAGAQKNMGPAGVTVVILRKELMGNVLPSTPTMLRYSVHAETQSMYNTPPAYAIYICGLVFKWVRDLGGVGVVHERNVEKAGMLYQFLDASHLFRGTAEKRDRSLMNIPFVTGSEELDGQFIKEARKKGIINIKGHRSVGGMRASIYNAMPAEGVSTLVELMKEFEEKHS
ncbi:MAG: 3-phosphoserine/phosphohydroxythreonine transaminase [Clostridia bacterium]